MAPPLDGHPSSDAAALDNVELGIGPSGTSGAYLSDDDDDDSDADMPQRKKPRLVEAGVQTNHATATSEGRNIAPELDAISGALIEPVVSGRSGAMPEDVPLVEAPEAASSEPTGRASIATLDLSGPIAPVPTDMPSDLAVAEPILTEEYQDEDEDPDRTLVLDDLDALTDSKVEPGEQNKEDHDLALGVEQGVQSQSSQGADLDMGPQRQEQAV
jgi:hypothetical protein